MIFGTPTALLLGLLALPVTLLYLLRVRTRRVPVSTDMFWTRVFEERPPRSLWKQFRHFKSWLFQILLLLTLTLAAADPRWSSPADQATFQVIILDTSASMQAEDDAGSRFEIARTGAKHVAAELFPGQQLAVISADRETQILCGFTDHNPALQRVISDATVTDSPADLRQAVLHAAALLRPHSDGRILLFTDALARADEQQLQQLCQRSDSDQPATAPRLEVIRCGVSQPNLGLTAFEVRRSSADPLGYEVLLELTNAADVPVSVRTELTLDDVLIDVITMSLDPDESSSRVLRKLSADGGILKARLTDIEFSEAAAGSDPAQDSLQADNQAFAVLPEQPPLRVLLVSPGNLFLRQALLAMPRVDLREITTLPQSQQDWSGFDLIVLHQLIPAELPAGNLLVVDPRDDCPLWELAGLIRQPLIVEQQSGSPLMTNIDLTDVLIPQVARLQFLQSAENLILTDSDASLLSVIQQPQRRCIVTPLSLSESDLPMRTVFPLLISNALQWFSGVDIQRTSAAATGTSAMAQLPSDWSKSTESVTIRSPSGTETTAVVSAGTAISPPGITTGLLRERGVWSVSPVLADKKAGSSGQTSVLRIAANLTDRSESDLRFPPDAEPTADSSATRVISRGIPLWLLAVCFAVLLLTAEWFLYQRRLIM